MTKLKYQRMVLIKLSLYLIKHHAMNTYDKVEAYLKTFSFVNTKNINEDHYLRILNLDSLLR
jgi:hypothetical protein